ncbi:MAG: radical SAM protein, partial [Acidobacteria bacterium]|nr:radical SAM protein [Acidobacteriota bacterium]
HRKGLVPLKQDAHLILPGGEHRVAGYTEASRGCKHLCRHCPIVPVYQGHFRVVDRDVVMADIRQQVAAGARHITFGDPDFFNGVGHAVAIVRWLHEEFPALTYDATIKIEHLLKHSTHLNTLRETGCLFVTSAVESIDDGVLALLDKGHTRRDFVEALRLCRKAGLTMSPTFVPFTPWITLEGYRELLALLAELDLVPNVAPIQLAIRLLIPAGSRLLELPAVLSLAGEFDQHALSYRWVHPDTRMDELCRDIQALIKQGKGRRATRQEIFREVWRLAYQDTAPGPAPALPDTLDRLDRAAIPYINEPWYC